jgi:isopropylmalate/homocitrate/citramalate synthase
VAGVARDRERVTAIRARVAQDDHDVGCDRAVVLEQLARLGVDIIEAGFAIASPGDFEAIKRIGGEIEGPVLCSLARAKEEDIKRAWEALKDAPKRTWALTSGR